MEMELLKNYHFVTTNYMADQINDFSKERKSSISKTLRFILKTMLPLLDYYQLFQVENDELWYSEFGSEVNIKFKINAVMYKKLKNLQGSMHSFSMAVIVRKMISIFFKYMELKGLSWLIERMHDIGKKIYKKMKKHGYHHKSQKMVVHMYGEEMMERYIVLMFSKNFTLLGSKLL